jgi:O-antigen/teichoic acid export membrane protein
MRKQSLKSQALAGSAWTLGGYSATQGVRLGSHLVLAWLLDPTMFGLMALVKVVQHGLGMFSDVGILPSIIRSQRGDDPVFLCTAWTIQVIRGIALWICACVLAWPLAAMFARNDPAAWQLLHLLPIAGFGAVIDGFTSPAVATLNRDLRLGKVTLLELGKQLAAVTVMIVWGYYSPTVWALIAGGLAGSSFGCLVSHFLVPGLRLRFAWNRDCISEIAHFGKWIFLSTAFSFLAINLDKLILGNILTLEHLGIYSIAFVFAKVPQYVGMRLSSTVLFPIYAKFRDDAEQMVSVALRARSLVLLLGMAVCCCLVVASPLFFETLWDPRYHEAGVIAQWMSLYIWTTIIQLTMSRIPLALGNSRAMFYSSVWMCTGSLLAVGGYILGALPGFICGLAIGPIISHIYLLRHVPSGQLALLRQSVRFTLLAVAYGATAVLTTNFVRSSFSELVWAALVVVLAVAPVLVVGVVGLKTVRGARRSSPAIGA